MPPQAQQINHGTQPIKDQPHHLDVQRAILALFVCQHTFCPTLPHYIYATQFRLHLN